jgi:hypothetical protein
VRRLGRPLDHLARAAARALLAGVARWVSAGPREREWVAALALLFATVTPRPGASAAQELSFSEVAAGVKVGSIWRIAVDGDRLQVEYQDHRRRTSWKDANADLRQQLREHGVTEEELKYLTIVSRPQRPNPLQRMFEPRPPDQ